MIFASVECQRPIFESSHVTTGNRGPTRIMASLGRMNMLQLFLFILDVRLRRIGEKISYHASQTTFGFWGVSVAYLIV